MLFITNLEPGVGTREVYEEMERLLETTFEIEIDSNNVAWVTFQPNQYTNILVNTIRLQGKFEVSRPLMWTWTIREDGVLNTDEVKEVATQDHQLHLLRYTL